MLTETDYDIYSILHILLFSQRFQLILPRNIYLSVFLRTEFVAMLKKRIHCSPLPTNNTNRSCLGYKGRSILLQLTRRLMCITWHLATYRQNVDTCLNQGRACKSHTYHQQSLESARVSFFIYQTGVIDTLLLRTLDNTAPLSAVGVSFERIPVEQQS